MGWIAPEFAAYPLGAQYTHWLYSDDKSNPAYWDRPDKWPEAGYVAFQDRSVSVTVGSGATPFLRTNTEIIDLDLTGGKNAVVFARYFEPIVAGGGITRQLPTQLGAYTWVRQRLVEGYLEIQDTPAVNVFGYGWAPHKFPAPITWNDKLRRQLYVSNTTGGEVIVTFVWKVAFLNTGA